MTSLTLNAMGWTKLSIRTRFAEYSAYTDSMQTESHWQFSQSAVSLCKHPVLESNTWKTFSVLSLSHANEKSNPFFIIFTYLPHDKYRKSMFARIPNVLSVNKQKLIGRVECSAKRHMCSVLLRIALVVCIEYTVIFRSGSVDEMLCLSSWPLETHSEWTLDK